MSSDRRGQDGPVLLRARWVFPVASPAIEDGAVRLKEGQIVEVGRWADLSGPGIMPCEDLGERALLPGLVNAHCHLDYTCLAGEIPPSASFTGWIQSMKAAKDTRSVAELRASWRAGADMLVRGGVTTVGDAEAFPELLPEVCPATPLRVLSFLELIRIRGDLDPEEPVVQALETITKLEETGLRCGLSPHAPYSTTPALLAACAKAARRHGLRQVIHLAESHEEFDMFMQRRGELCEWLLANGRDCADCGRGSPVAQVAAAGLLGPEVAAIHVNYLAPGDVTALGESGTHVVHCPRSHEYFGHTPFPFTELRAAGVSVSLGTDSLATVRTERGFLPKLDLLAEMAAFRRNHPDVHAAEVLRMATVNAARALGLEGEAGVIVPGVRADLFHVPATGDATEVLESLVSDQARPGGVMIGGRWVAREPAA